MCIHTEVFDIIGLPIVFAVPVISLCEDSIIYIGIINFCFFIILGKSLHYDNLLKKVDI